MSPSLVHIIQMFSYFQFSDTFMDHRLHHAPSKHSQEYHTHKARQGNWFNLNTILERKKLENMSLAAKGALAHPRQRLQNPKWLPVGPKMVDVVWKRV